MPSRARPRIAPGTVEGIAVLATLALSVATYAGIDLQVDNGVPVQAEAVATEAVTFRCRIPAGALVRADARPRSRQRAWSLRLVRASDGFEVMAEESRAKVRIRGVEAPTTGWYTLTVRGDGDGDGRFRFRASWKTPSRFRFDGALGAAGLDVPFVADQGSTVLVSVKAPAGTIPTVEGVVGSTSGIDVDVPPDSVANLRKAKVRTGVVTETDEFIARIGEVGRTGANVKGSVRVRRGGRMRGVARAEVDKFAGRGLSTPLFGRTIGGRGGTLTLDLPQANSLNGCAAHVPAPSIRKATAVVVAEAAELDAPTTSLVPLGPTVYFGPDDRFFRNAVEVTLALDPDTHPETLDDMVVLRRDAAGDVSEVPRPLFAVDSAAATVTILTDYLATFRAFGPRPSELLVGTQVVLGNEEIETPERLGTSVAAEGDTLLVGAPLTTNREGRALVYRLRDDGWELEAELSAPQPASFDEFGGAVAIWGSTAVVGARFADGATDDEGACFVFERIEDEWVFSARLTADDAAFYDQFGGAIAIHHDTLAIGAHHDDDHGDRSGAVYLFRRSDASWSPWQKLTSAQAGAGAELGSSLALDGGTLVVGAPQASDGDGAVVVFQQVDQRWVPTQHVVPTVPRTGSEFGAAVGVRRDEMVVGAPAGAEGAAYAVTRRAGIWQDPRLLTTGPSVGSAVAVRHDVLAVGAPVADDDGAVEVFQDVAGAWTARASLSGSNGAQEHFGAALCLVPGAMYVGAPLSPRTESGSGLVLVYPLDR